MEGPREGSLLKGDCLREREKRAEILPETLCQRTREKKMTQCLNLVRTEVTERLLQSEVANPTVQRQGVKEKFIKCLLVTECTGTVVAT